MKQTAVGWLIMQLPVKIRVELYEQNIHEQAKQMEKEQKGYSKEEVVELLYKHTEYMLSGKKDTLDKWIEENL